MDFQNMTSLYGVRFRRDIMKKKSNMPIIVANMFAPVTFIEGLLLDSAELMVVTAIVGIILSISTSTYICFRNSKDKEEK